MKVVVVGAGYAGTVAANRLARRAREAEVTIVNPRVDFVERIRLHQLIAGTDSAARPLADVLDRRVSVRVASVDKIGDGVVRLDDGTELDFDRLVYAAGGAVTAPRGTLAVGGVDDAREAAQRLGALPEGSVVDVIGGGLTGVETAAEVASERADLTVRLISDGPLAPSLGEPARRRVEQVLDGLHVQRIRGTWDDDGQAQLTLWAVARQVSDVARRSGWAVDDDGRVIVDERLRSVSDPRVYAVGDAAAVPRSRMSCQAALPQGTYAADAIVRELRGRTARPYSMGFAAQCVSLGRSDGVVQRVHRDDSPAGFWLGGRTGALVKEQVCRSTMIIARTSRNAWLPGPS
ncbi:NAD(P)/FAD-dependent oxidoreductase [Gordonia phthalatica]|uniref:Dehydrogenase n=1 Tax=Gordonia phthalatica TaxID=1136941 RepID=A0A0N9NEC0_9ACTN|nr:FAD-dependent oxidoreductase [Gordonia phthalatica]ALG85472.1 dehydrogenase [Gordonia phthalatica]